MKRKFFLYSILAVGILFLLTNPTQTDFKNYLGSVNDNVIIRTTGNYLFFSTYSISIKDIFNPESNVINYIGILKNFYEKKSVDPAMITAEEAAAEKLTEDSVEVAILKAAEKSAADQAEADSAYEAEKKWKDEIFGSRK